MLSRKGGKNTLFIDWNVSKFKVQLVEANQDCFSRPMGLLYWSTKNIAKENRKRKIGTHFLALCKIKFFQLQGTLNKI